MLHVAYFKQGKGAGVYYKNSYVETDRFLLEHEAAQPLILRVREQHWAHATQTRAKLTRSVARRYS